MKNNKFEFEWITQSGQIFPLPTIRITHDKFLFGYYTFELVWIKWGLSINIDL